MTVTKANTQQVEEPKTLTDADCEKLTKRLAKAKTSLILEHPFIGTIALNMPFQLDYGVPTAGTNGKRVIFNPDFIEPLTDDELKFLVAHECLHPMLEHNYRRMGRDPRKWNRAGDYVINQVLTDDNIGSMIEGGCQSQPIYDAGKGTSDGIYEILEDEPDDGSGSGATGPGYQDCEDAEGNQAEQTQAQAGMKIKVAQAAQAAKMMGKMSAGLERLVDEVLNPKVDWREVLRRFVVRHRSDTRSWARPNRRFLAQGMYLPNMSGEALGEICFAIDCSGSIGQEELNQFSAEIMTVKEDSNPSVIHLVYFDSEVCHYEKFERDDEVHVEPHGGGGTAFSPIFKYMADNAIEPIATVVLTDLCCSDFGDAPEYPVLWVSNHSEDAPWGEIVMM